MPYADKRKERQSKHDRYLIRKQDPEFVAKQQKYRDDHAEQNREYQRIYRLTHAEQLSELKARRKHLWKSGQKEYQREYGRQLARNLKLEVVAGYGGKCECCGDSHFEFLTIDHINGDGAIHRKQCGTGQPFYRWLRRKGFPKEDFRLLCINCNFSFGKFGYCPHEVKRSLPKVVESS